MLQLDATPYTLHFHKPAPTSRGPLTTRAIWLVRAWCTTAPHVTGWGECGPLPALSRDDTPDFGAEIMRRCAEFNVAAFTTIRAARAWVETQVADWPSLAFGAETALRDLAAGGQRRLWETPFARGEAGLPTHGLIWMDTPDAIMRQIEAKVAAGFTVIKMKIGALPFAEELALLQATRRKWPRIELRLDANGAFAPEDALDRLDSLAPYAIAFVEQPVRPGQWGVLADLCRHSPVPVALDEELIPIRTAAARDRLLTEVRPQYLILKPALLGGFAVCESWIAVANLRSIRWIVNSLLESTIGLNAISQWTSTVGGATIHGLGSGSLFSNNVPSPLALQDGQLRLTPAQRWQWPASTE